MKAGTVRLPAIIGLGRALDLVCNYECKAINVLMLQILTGRPVHAQEALAIGLATSVVPKGQAKQAAIDLARKLCSLPQVALYCSV